MGKHDADNQINRSKTVDDINLRIEEDKQQNNEFIDSFVSVEKDKLLAEYNKENGFEGGNAGRASVRLKRPKRNIEFNELKEKTDKIDLIIPKEDESFDVQEYENILDNTLKKKLDPDDAMDVRKKKIKYPKSISAARTRFINAERQALGNDAVQRQSYKDLGYFDKKKRKKKAEERTLLSAKLDEIRETLDIAPMINEPKNSKDVVNLANFFFSLFNKEYDLSSDEKFVKNLKDNYKDCIMAEKIGEYIDKAEAEGFLPESKELNIFRFRNILNEYAHRKVYLEARMNLMQNEYYKYIADEDITYDDKKLKKLSEKTKDEGLRYYFKELRKVREASKSKYLSVKEPVKKNPVPLTKIEKEYQYSNTVKKRYEQEKQIFTILGDKASNDMKRPGYPGYNKVVKNILNALVKIKEDGVEKSDVLIRKVVNGIFDVIKTLKDLNYKTDYDVINEYATTLKELYYHDQGSLDAKGAKIIDKTDDKIFEKDDIQMPYKVKSLKDVRLKVEVNKQSDISHMPLFRRDISVADVKQGNIGDCIMISSLISIIESNPDLIKQAMRDEGSTVLVRFFKKDGTPLYVRVKKSFPVIMAYGTDKTTNKPKKVFVKRLGADGAEWVNIIEKAYSAVNDQLGLKNTRSSLPPAGYENLHGGIYGDFIRCLTGRKMSEIGLFESTGKERKYTSLGTFIYNAHYHDKKDFMAANNPDGTKRTARDWNMYKAQKIFGVEADTREKYELFRTNRVFNSYYSYLAEFMSETFESGQTKSFRTQNIRLGKMGFNSISDLDLFMKMLDISKLPDFPEYTADENKLMKKSYMNYFVNVNLAALSLQNAINFTGVYSDKEMDVFKKIKKATSTKGGKEKKIVIAGVTYTTLSAKGGKKGEREGRQLGLASWHNYSVLDTDEKTEVINGKEVKVRYVVVCNPWASNEVRLYDKNTGKAYSSLDQKGYDPKGFFKMELSDFYNTFDRVVVM